ncbi:MAG TPA: 50S ribosomal protein L4 [Spirochaetota bacterium]|nr:50S ribosomal protein L4 [Spirochaetota bacterium]
MKFEVTPVNDNAKETIELSDRVFNSKVNKNTIYEAIKNVLANKRQGTASVKTRRTVHGTNKKPYRQKGTGRSRAGSNKSPLWQGGGVIFGPAPREYNYSIPRKVKQQAVCSVLSMFCHNNKLTVLADFKQERYKTRDVAAVFSKVSGQKKVLYILNSDERENYEKIRKSSSNIPWLKLVNSKAINIKDLYYADEIVLSRTAAAEINQRYGN